MSTSNDTAVVEVTQAPRMIVARGLVLNIPPFQFDPTEHEYFCFVPALGREYSAHDDGKLRKLIADALANHLAHIAKCPEDAELLAADSDALALEAAA